ncbi:MAG: hypothetical protein HQL64_17175 [Magnetococcales bacterium]|nr:hypothetical protein [Magnetococcales bacterium]
MEVVRLRGLCGMRRRSGREKILDRYFFAPCCHNVAIDSLDLDHDGVKGSIMEAKNMMDKRRFLSLMFVVILWPFLTGLSGVDEWFEKWLDCRRLPSITVDTICSYRDTYELLRSVEERADAISSGFSDPEMIAIIDVDILEWIFSLDNCDGDRSCLMNEFNKRNYMLGKNNLSEPFIGQFFGKIPDSLEIIGIYPVNKEYIVGISINKYAKHMNAKCIINGHGVQDGKRLLVTVGEKEDAVTFPITLRDSRVLVIEDSPEVRQVQHKYCGSDGHFTGIYYRWGME